MHDLTFSRVQELIADLERQRRVLLNAALIEARDREANAAAQITQAPTRQSFPLSSVTENVQDFSQAESHPSDPSLTHKADATTTVPSRGDQQPPKPPKSIPNTPQVSDETQSWAPRTIRRGG